VVLFRQFDGGVGQRAGVVLHEHRDVHAANR
jgi:hypothetical protein